MYRLLSTDALKMKFDALLLQAHSAQSVSRYFFAIMRKIRVYMHGKINTVSVTVRNKNIGYRLSPPSVSCQRQRAPSKAASDPADHRLARPGPG